MKEKYPTLEKNDKYIDSLSYDYKSPFSVLLNKLFGKIADGIGTGIKNLFGADELSYDISGVDYRNLEPEPYFSMGSISYAGTGRESRSAMSFLGFVETVLPDLSLKNIPSNLL